MALKTIKLTPNIGTEIKTSPAALLAGDFAAQLNQLLEQRGVLIFRELNFNDEQQVIFAKTLGSVSPGGTDGVVKVTHDPQQNPTSAEYQRGAVYWHIDTAMNDIPARASLLNAKGLPAGEGGQTEVCNTYAAYQNLPEPDKQLIEKLMVVHTLEAAQRMVHVEPTYEQVQGWQRFAPKLHPLVWTHRSGRKSLVLGATASHIEGLDLAEGRALLCRLREWATQPHYVYRHEWRPGDMLIWDNTGTMHRVRPYDPEGGRMMHRVTLVGEERLVGHLS